MDKQEDIVAEDARPNSALRAAYRELDKMTATGSERSCEPVRVLGLSEIVAAYLTPITCQDDLVAALRRRRAALRMTCLDLDYRAGFQDGYTAHLESPHSRSGRNSLKLNPMAVLWLDALGMTLAIVPQSTCRT